jgi:hypothetical protein
MEGLDALILFIALLLVATVVGAILITTNSALMQRDVTVQKEKTKGIQRPILVEAVRGRDNDGDKRLDDLNIALRLREGDEPISFNETVLLVTSKNINCTSLSYGPDADPYCAYRITYAKRGRDYEEHRMNTGDLVEIDYDGPGVVGGQFDGHAKLMLIPSHGMPTEVMMEIPDRIHPQNMALWPLKD